MLEREMTLAVRGVRVYPRGVYPRGQLLPAPALTCDDAPPGEPTNRLG
jgi:hypothetical protein